MCVKMDTQGATMSHKAAQSAKETPQGFAECHKDPKNIYKPPAAGCSPKATYMIGRGTNYHNAIVQLDALYCFSMGPEAKTSPC